MKKMFLAFTMLGLIAIMTGCGHNVIQYGDGVGFEASINPENYTLGLTLRYGKILSMVTRDNVEVELTGKANTSGSTGTEKAGSATMGTDGNLKIKIGCQINGAAVDLVEAGAPAEKVLETLKKENSSEKSFSVSEEK